MPRGAAIVFDSNGVAQHANDAARRLLGVEAGASATACAQRLGEPVLAWLGMLLRFAPRDGALADSAPEVALDDGTFARIDLFPIDAGRFVLTLAMPTRARALQDDPLRALWDSPWPATLEDLDFRYVAVNDAFVAMTGYARDQLIGADPIALAPPEDRALAVDWRRDQKARLLEGASVATSACRLIDAHARERWYRALRAAVRDEHGRTRLLAVLHDCTDEYRFRSAAERGVRESDEWFATCPLGIVLFDSQGRVVRSNAAFEALAGAPPAALADAPAALRRLLAFDGVRPGGPAVVREALVAGPDARSRPLRAHLHRLSGWRNARFIAWVEDASCASELELARAQVRALIDGTGAALATLHPSLGWVRGGAPAAREDGASQGTAAALSAIARDAVVPESLPAYVALQRALREGRRARLRYAIRHADIGTRWLVTSVEPGELPSGGRATSVVTQDVTEREEERLQGEQRVRELSAIIEGAGAGIAWLRDDSMLYCNSGFARLLSADGKALVGVRLSELEGLPGNLRALLVEAMKALVETRLFEAQVEIDGERDMSRRCLLSVRRLTDVIAPLDAVAVLVDVAQDATTRKSDTQVSA